MSGATPQTARREETRMVLLPVAEDPTISFSVSFRTGSQNDPPGKEGLAYVTGQMIAEASTRDNAYQTIIERLYPLAAGYSIRVDRETTTLTGRTHRDTAEQYAELFTDAYLAPAFEAEDFARIRRDAVNYLENTLRYSSDEELGKAALHQFVFEGTPYAHPPQGTVAGLESITLEDVRDFYRRHYTAGNVLIALGGGFRDALAERMRATPNALPDGEASQAPEIEPHPIAGRQVRLVAKRGADASISFGFPLDVRRGERDFYALAIANSWLGEHRHQAGHLFQVIREQRGLNYGNYSYIEAFPEGGRRTKPPVNVPRRRQLFEIWIRTLPDAQALFALRAALRELRSLIEHGLGVKEFELTRSFLRKYVLHFADSTAARLGYAVDDRFYGLETPGHLERFTRMMDELSVDEVNDAITRHLRHESLKIAMVTGNPEGLRQALASDEPTPVEYETPKSAAIRREDSKIAAFPLQVDAGSVREIPVSAMFDRAGSGEELSRS